MNQFVTLHPIPIRIPDFLGRLVTKGAVAAAAIILGLGTAWAVKDYNAYLALGPGGPPYNIFGWIVVNIAI
ncbi:hypothetical protein ACHAQH_003478, partial [Verticillium albo-atrum]